MKPKRIILVRHAESVGNTDKSHYSHTPDFKIPLTEHGHHQSISAGKAILKLIGNEDVYAYVSPWLRTRQTFQNISNQLRGRIIRSVEDPRLREQDWGHYKAVDELTIENQLRKSYGKFHFRIQDGESGADVFDRVSTFLETIHRDFSKPDYPQNALIVTHGVTLSIFCMRWFHWTVEEWESYRNPENAAVVVMEMDSSGHYKLITPFSQSR